MPAFEIVKKAWDERKDFHESGEFIFMKTTCPWKDHLFTLEKEQELEGHAKFVMYQDERGLYRIQAVPVKGVDFQNRVSICKDLRGLRTDDLNKAAGITDGEFVHAAGFIGGAWSLESVMKLAVESIKEHSADEAAKEPEKKKQRVE